MLAYTSITANSGANCFEFILEAESPVGGPSRAALREAIVKLGRCLLADSKEIRLGANPVALVMTEGQGSSRVWNLSQSQKPFVGKILTQWFSPASGQALQFGFVSFDRAEVVVESGWDQARRVPTVSAWMDFQGFELAPGASNHGAEPVWQRGQEA